MHNNSWHCRLGGRSSEHPANPGAPPPDQRGGENQIDDREGIREMTARLRMFSGPVLALGCLAFASTASAATSCEGLDRLELPGIASISAKSFPGGTFQPPDPT